MAIFQSSCSSNQQAPCAQESALAGLCNLCPRRMAVNRALVMAVKHPSAHTPPASGEPGAARPAFGHFGFAARKRFLKGVAKYVPSNSVRVWALRQCGYTIGEHVYIGEELQIIDELDDRHPPLTIGDRASLAARIIIVLDSHPNWSRLSEAVPLVHGSVHIDQDAWIGAGAILLPNVTIGEQSIIGAGSVVTRDVPPGMVATGNPARVRRSVFERDSGK